MRIDDIIKYTIASSLILFAYFVVIPMIQLSIDTKKINVGYLNFLSSLYLERLKYCFRDYNKINNIRPYDFYIYIFYIPSLHLQDSITFYKDHSWRCFNIIGGELTEYLNLDESNKEITYKEITYSSSPYISIKEIGNNLNSGNSKIDINTFENIIKSIDNSANILQAITIYTFRDLFLDGPLITIAKNLYDVVKNSFSNNEKFTGVYTKYALPIIATDKYGRLYIVYPYSYGYFEIKCKKLKIEGNDIKISDVKDTNGINCNSNPNP